MIITCKRVALLCELAALVPALLCSAASVFIEPLLPLYFPIGGVVGGLSVDLSPEKSLPPLELPIRVIE